MSHLELQCEGKLHKAPREMGEILKQEHAVTRHATEKAKGWDNHGKHEMRWRVKSSQRSYRTEKQKEFYDKTLERGLFPLKSKSKYRRSSPAITQLHFLQKPQPIVNSGPKALNGNFHKQSYISMCALNKNMNHVFFPYVPINFILQWLHRLGTIIVVI